MFLLSKVSIYSVAIASTILLGGASTTQPCGNMCPSDGFAKLLSPTSDQVTVGAADDDKAVPISIAPGDADYPGVDIKPVAAWDLSSYGYVDVTVKNTGDNAVFLTLRLDNAGDWKESPWSSAGSSIKPGDIGSIRVYFGWSFGKPGYPLKSNSIILAKVFAGKVDHDSVSLRLLSLSAGGQPGETPSENK